MHRGWAPESSLIMRCFLPVLRINSECVLVWDAGLQVTSGNSLKLKITSRTLYSSATDFRELVGNQPPEFLFLVLAYPYHFQRNMIDCPDSWGCERLGFIPYWKYTISSEVLLQQPQVMHVGILFFFSLAIVSPRDPFSWNYTCVQEESVFGMYNLSSFLQISPQVVVL